MSLKRIRWGSVLIYFLAVGFVLASQLSEVFAEGVGEKLIPLEQGNSPATSVKQESDSSQALPQPEPEPKDRLEFSASTEYLNPHQIYGSWNSLSTAYYTQPSSDFSYSFQLAGFSRMEGKATLGVASASKDWNSWFYTSSSVSRGTNSVYLPSFRFDQDFNFKVGRNQAIVLTGGVSQVNYFNNSTNWIYSVGSTYYARDWIFEYRLFQNNSFPGNITSYTHLLSAGYGREGWQWTYLVGSIGAQAYLATSLLLPQQVNQQAYSIGIVHRQWVHKHSGFMINTGYLKLVTGYDKYNFLIGVFNEF